MNSHGINKKNLLTAFPIALQKDKSAVSIGDGTAELLAARLREIDLLRIYTRIDELDEEMLDILACDFKIDWWDPNYSLEEKRQTLKDSWHVHRALGTKAAVESAISAIYPNTKVVEWFETGGAPYTFWLCINAANLRTDTERHARIMKRVDYYKNLRSHLDGFIWQFPGAFVNEPDLFRLHRLIISAAFSNLRNINPVPFDGSALFDGAIQFGRGSGSMFGVSTFKVSAAIEEVEETLRMAGVKWGGISFQNEQRFELGALRMAFPAFDNKRNLLPRHFFDGDIGFDGSALFDNVKGSLFGLYALKIRTALHDLRDDLTVALRNRYTFHEWPGRWSLRFDGQGYFDSSVLFNQSSGGVVRLNSFKAAAAVPHTESVAAARLTVSSDMPRKHERIGGTIAINNWHTFGGEDTFGGSRRFDAEITQEVL